MILIVFVQCLDSNRKEQTNTDSAAESVAPAVSGLMGAL